MPDWIIRTLEGMGVPGAIIFVLLTALGASIAYIRSMQAKADKVYGYRLAERDTLNKALSDTASSISKLSEVTEDRNDLTEEQTKLIAAQAQALELLKVTILSQYDSIKDQNVSIKEYHSGTAMAVTAMAEAVRTLTSIVMENRTIALTHVNDVRKSLAEMGDKITEAIKASGQVQTIQLKTLLGGVTVTKRRKVSK